MGRTRKSRLPGRLPKNVEFLDTLQQLTGFKSSGDFAKACGKKASNMTNYLTGSLRPGPDVLRSCLTSLYEWGVTAVLEVEIRPPFNAITTQAGIYVLYDSAGNVLYIGKATNLRAELRQTLERAVPVALRFGPTLIKVRPLLKELATRASLYAVASPRVRHNLEALLLRIIPNQTHNSNIGRFK